MPNKTYSTVQKLAGAVLARLKGADAAAAELRVDNRTVARWLKAAPEDGWTLARDLAQARLQEQLATGRINASQLATVAGIADRNVRYGELLRQREARKQGEQEAEQPDPEQEAWRTALHSLPDLRKRWIADALRYNLERRQTNPDEAPADQAGEALGAKHYMDMLAWLNAVAGWTDDEFAEQRALLDSEIAELDAQTEAAWEQRRQPAPAPEPPPPVPDAATTPPEPPQPPLRVVDDYPGAWTPWRRDDSW